MSVSLRKYDKRIDAEKVASVTRSLGERAGSFHDPGAMRILMSLVDLTSLNSTDTVAGVQLLCEKVNHLNDHYPEIPNVAAICVYPSLVGTVKARLSFPGVHIASVAGGFPSAQTFPAIKYDECRMALEAGADEIDVVLPLGLFLAGDLNGADKEIREIKKILGNSSLKIILETGALPDYSQIRSAALLAMEAGADFIKTSTGKLQPAATPEAVWIMCDAIRDYCSATGRRVGIKPAGGISTAAEAVVYYLLVSDMLDDEWLSPSLFRIGASRLANSLISELESAETGRRMEIVYF